MWHNNTINILSRWTFFKANSFHWLVSILSVIYHSSDINLCLHRITTIRSQLPTVKTIKRDFICTSARTLGAYNYWLLDLLYTTIPLCKENVDLSQSYRNLTGLELRVFNHDNESDLRTLIIRSCSRHNKANRVSLWFHTLNVWALLLVAGEGKV